jgi:hypothetical protein
MSKIVITTASNAEAQANLERSVVEGALGEPTARWTKHFDTPWCVWEGPFAVTASGVVVAELRLEQKRAETRGRLERSARSRYRDGGMTLEQLKVRLSEIG